MTKYDLIKEFVENLSDNELFSLWCECASDGEVEYIEGMDSIDDLFKPTSILRLDLDAFDVRDEYFVDDGCNALISYGCVRDAIDDGFVGDLDDLIDWIDEDYDGWNDELIGLLNSEEYRKAV